MLANDKVVVQEIDSSGINLETVAKVSNAIAAILDMDELLQTAADIANSSFRLYHAQFYVLDEKNEVLILEAGAGEVGKSLKAKGHQIPLAHEHSVVARAARTRSGLISNDVLNDANFLPNSLLPLTRSEMAIPMISGDTLVGILDVQDVMANRFTPEDVRIKTILAAQIAAAVQNARTFDRMRQAQEESRRLFDVSVDMVSTIGFDGYFKTVNPAWERTLGYTRAELLAEPFINFVHPDDIERTNRELEDQLKMGALTLSFHNRYRAKDGSYHWLSWNAVPYINDGVIYSITRDVTEERRLNEEVNRRAAELEAIAEVSTAATQILNVDEMLETVSNLTKKSFNLYQAHVYLLDEAGTSLVLAGGAGEAGRAMKDRGHQIAIDYEHSLVAQSARTRQGAIINDVQQNPNFLPNPDLPDTRSELVVPMVVGDQLVGVLDIQSEQVGYFVETDVNVMNTLAAQVAVAVRNARVFAEVRKAQYETEQIYNVSLDMISIVGFDGYFKTLNPAWQPALGYTNEELLAIPYIDLVHPDDIATTNAEAAKIAEGATTISFENRYRRKDGSYIWFSWSVVPRIEEGLMYCVTRDVTTEKLAREETEILYAFSNRLTTAKSRQDLLTTVSDYAISQGGAGASLMYFDANDLGSPDWGEIVAQIQLSGNPLPVGTRLKLSDFAVAKLWIGSPETPLFIGDTQDPKTIDQITREIYMQVGQFAVVIMPLYLQGRWLGLVQCQWDTAQQFTEQDRRIYAAMCSQLTPVVDAVRSSEALAVAQRETEQRAIELETVAEVSTAASSVLDIDVLLSTVVELTKSRFHLYHAHIYLLDATKKTLVLASGAGEAGQKMKEEGRAIALDNLGSLVARAGRSRQGVIENNVTAAADFLPNPYLPDTRSELAIPMVVGDELIGVLDIQSEKVGRFAESDVSVMTTLTAQVAVAVQNARVFAEVRKAQYETEQIYNVSLDMISIVGFDGYFKTLNPAWQPALGYTNEELLAIPYIDLVHPDDIATTNAEAAKIAEGATTISFENRYRRKDGSYTWFSWSVVPRIEEGLMYCVTRDVTTEKLAREETEILYAFSNRLTTAKTRQDLLTTVSDYAISRGGFGASLMYFDLNEQGDPDWGEIVAQIQLSGTPLPVGARLKLSDFAVAKLWIASPETPLFIGDTQDPATIDQATREIYEQIGQLATVIMPLYLQGRWIGLVQCQWDSPQQFTEQDRRIYSAMRNQLTPVVDAVRSSEALQVAQKETEQRATELETVAEVSTAAASVLDIDTLLSTVVELTKSRFHLYHAQIYLLDTDTQNLVLAGGAGEAGQTMKQRGHHISINYEHSLVAQCARTHQGVIVNDVQQNPNFLPNPLLPLTRAEMAIPMLVRDTLIGVLDVQSENVGRFDQNDVRLKTTLAAQIAVAVQNARSYQQQVELVEQLQTVDRLKSEFLASMSHELRTPLNSIIGYSRMLLDGADGELQDEMAEDMDAIFNSGQHLLHLINDILDLAKIEAGRLEIDPEKVALGSIVDEVVRMTSVLLHSKAVELVTDVDGQLPTLWADPVRLRQVLNNLISNAIKFTEQGEIRIKAWPENDKVIIGVMDTGMGINPDQLERVFERFHQADSSSTRKAGGTGLGLTITRHLIEMHGGTIWAESEVGKGTTFWFSIPTAA